MDESKEKIKELIDECDNQALVDYLLNWVAYAIQYYQQEKH